jgi:hypothetical protein
VGAGGREVRGGAGRTRGRGGSYAATSFHLPVHVRRAPAGPGRDTRRRRLAPGGAIFETYAAAREAIARLRVGWERVTTLEWADDASGQWVWRIELDGTTVAVSSRSYLRARECTYNLARFLEAVPAADIADGTRAVHHHGTRSTEDDGLRATARSPS